MNSQMLLDKMAEQKISVGEISKKLGMSRSAFYRKTHGITEFTLSEIQGICAILNLTSPVEIFFTSKVS